MFNFTLILWCCVLSVQLKIVVSITQQFFNNDVMVLEGLNISSSDIKCSMADRKVSKIHVYVANTFHANENLNLNGITDLQIFAYTWNITKPVTFDLSGSDGTDRNQELVGDGLAGNVGNRGTNGGNFFGLAKETINGDYLIVRSNGGNGGNGEVGGTSDDVHVLLNVDKYSGEIGWRSNVDLHNYYKKFFDDKGYDSEIMDVNGDASSNVFIGHNMMVSFNIRLHPRKCCGTTGIGGAGKILSYLGEEDCFFLNKRIFHLQEDWAVEVGS